MLGLIGTKLGMTQVFNEDGEILPVTVIKVEPNSVVKKRNLQSDGYNALVLGVKDKKEKKVNKPYKNIFPDNVSPKHFLKEFRGYNIEDYKVGQEITVDFFKDEEFIDVTAYTKGKGFQGVMKRHGFSGGPKTHGSKFHRQNGATGQCAYPARALRGSKRAGKMGNKKRTVQNLKIIKVISEENMILVKGNVPGNKKGIVYVKRSCKKQKRG